MGFVTKNNKLVEKASRHARIFRQLKGLEAQVKAARPLLAKLAADKKYHGVAFEARNTKDMLEKMVNALLRLERTMVGGGLNR